MGIDTKSKKIWEQTGAPIGNIPTESIISRFDECLRSIDSESSVPV